MLRRLIARRLRAIAARLDPRSRRVTSPLTRSCSTLRLLPALAALFAILFVFSLTMIATTQAQRCSPACEARVKARAFAERHGGCRSSVCVQRVRAKMQAREIRALTPYRCATGRFAIPCRIIQCESRGRWTAYNASSAAGPYQLMGFHGRPWPVRTRADRLAHHRIAARLWRGGAGASQWVCK